MLVWISVAVWFYLTARIIAPLPIARLWRVVLSVALLIVLRHHYATYLLWGSMFSPEVPRAVVIVVNALFGASVILAVLQALADIAALALAAVRRVWSPVPALLRGAFALVALAVSGSAVSSAIVVPDLKEVEVEIADLPAALDGFQFVHLTDLHVSRLFDAPWVERLVDRVMALEPAMILVTGDVIDGLPERRLGDIAPLARLQAEHGVFHIAGNHEYYFGFDGWMGQFADFGWRSVVNRHEIVDIEGAQLVVAGVADQVARSQGQQGPDLGAAIGGSPDAPVILLQHRPGGAARNALAGVDLQLSGHTHGGMLVGFDRLVASANDGFVSGTYQVDDMTLYVSNGTALWPGFAFRLMRPPELTRITLRGA